MIIFRGYNRMPSSFKMRSALRRKWKEENDKEINKLIPYSNENVSPVRAPDAQNPYDILQYYNNSVKPASQTPNTRSPSPKRKTKKRKVKGGYKKKNTRRRLR